MNRLIGKKEHTMKKIIIFLIVILLPSIVEANENIEIKMSDAVKVGNVVVKPSTEYIVDLTGYKIPKEAKLIIFHVLDSPKSHYYYQKIKPGKLVYQMKSNELKAATDSPPFNGLKKDDSAFLIIGSESQPGSINMGVLFSNESISVIVRN
jgi:hypothetical protein